MDVSKNVAVTMGTFKRASQQDLDSLNWTMGEILVAKKLANSGFISSFQKLGDRVIENVWGQIELNGGDKRVDFLVFTDEFLFVIEVKDYSRYSQISDGSDSRKIPWEQLEEYIQHINDRIEGMLAVRGLLVFPFLKRGKEKTFGQIILKTTYPRIAVGFAEDLEGRNLEKLFQSAEKRYLQDIPFAPNMLCAMKKLISSAFARENVPCSEELSIYTLEQKQLKFSHNLFFNGDRIVYGVAGSGKTILLVRKAKQLATLFGDEKKILVVCFNKPLQIYLKRELRSYPNVIVKTIHAWYRYVLRLWDDLIHEELLEKLESGEVNTSFYFDLLPKLVEEGLKQGMALPKYASVLIDEGQDFDKLWLRHLKQAHDLSNPFGLFLVCLDSLQAIHKRKKGFRWSEIGIEARGRTIYLRTNYRNSRKFDEYAFRVLGDLLKQSGNSKDDVSDVVLESDVFVAPGGDVLAIRISREELVVTLKELLAKLREQKETGLIIAESKDIIPSEILGINNENESFPIIDCFQENKHVLPSNKEVPLLSVYRSKGLEADTVIYLEEGKF